MATFQNLNLSYSQWKSVRARIATPSYYFLTPGHYTLILVDFARGLSYTAKLVHNLPVDTNPDTIDFITNIQPSSILQIDYDSCVAAAVIG